MRQSRFPEQYTTTNYDLNANITSTTFHDSILAKDSYSHKRGVIPQRIPLQVTGSFTVKPLRIVDSESDYLFQNSPNQPPIKPLDERREDVRISGNPIGATRSSGPQWSSSHTRLTREHDDRLTVGDVKQTTPSSENLQPSDYDTRPFNADGKRPFPTHEHSQSSDSDTRPFNADGKRPLPTHEHSQSSDSDTGPFNVDGKRPLPTHEHSQPSDYDTRPFNADGKRPFPTHEHSQSSDSDTRPFNADGKRPLPIHEHSQSSDSDTGPFNVDGKRPLPTHEHSQPPDINIPLLGPNVNGDPVEDGRRPIKTINPTFLLNSGTGLNRKDDDQKEGKDKSSPHYPFNALFILLIVLIILILGTVAFAFKFRFLAAPITTSNYSREVTKTSPKYYVKLTDGSGSETIKYRYEIIQVKISISGSYRFECRIENVPYFVSVGNIDLYSQNFDTRDLSNNRLKYQYGVEGIHKNSFGVSAEPGIYLLVVSIIDGHEKSVSISITGPANVIFS